MKITDALLAEHEALYLLLDSVEKSAAGANLNLMKGNADRLYRAFRNHGDAEHDLLFGALEHKPSQHQGAVQAMRNEHAEIDDSLLRLRTLDDQERARLLLLHAVEITRDHMQREEQVYFKRARQALGDQRLEELGAEYLRRRAVQPAPNSSFVLRSS